MSLFHVCVLLAHSLCTLCNPRPEQRRPDAGLRRGGGDQVRLLQERHQGHDARRVRNVPEDRSRPGAARRERLLRPGRASQGGGELAGAGRLLAGRRSQSSRERQDGRGCRGTGRVGFRKCAGPFVVKAGGSAGRLSGGTLPGWLFLWTRVVSCDVIFYKNTSAV